MKRQYKTMAVVALISASILSYAPAKVVDIESMDGLSGSSPCMCVDIGSCIKNPSNANGPCPVGVFLAGNFPPPKSCPRLTGIRGYHEFCIEPYDNSTDKTCSSGTAVVGDCTEYLPAVCVPQVLGEVGGTTGIGVIVTVPTYSYACVASGGGATVWTQDSLKRASGSSCHF